MRAACPGRQELDLTKGDQLALCHPVVNTGSPRIAHEFVPTCDPLTSPSEATALWDMYYRLGPGGVST